MPGAIAAEMGSDQLVRIEVQNAVACPYLAGDPDVAAFKLRFSLRVANRSRTAVDIPRSGAGGLQATGVVVVGVQAKQPGNKWTHIVQSSWYDAGAVKSCGSMS